MARADLWCSAYYPGYQQANLPPSAIDLTAITDLIHFSVFPNYDGTLNTNVNGITSAIYVGIQIAGKYRRYLMTKN